MKFHVNFGFNALNQFTTEHLPPFALEDDNIVEIQGEPAGVHKGVELVASHLRKFLVDRSIIGVLEKQVSLLILPHPWNMFKRGHRMWISPI